MEIYSVEHLSFAYPNAKKNVLSDISFSVQEGEFVTLCGLSGSGKSTLLRQLKTVLRPHGERSGMVYYQGKPLDETDELTQAGKIGFVMQSPDHQSITDKVWHELAFGLENLAVPPAVIRRRTAEIAAFFGLDIHQKISALSGGQKQILHLASVMMMEPSVLILDEPTAQLDPMASEEFLRLLQKIREQFGTTVILCEHTLEEVCTLTDRIIILENGKILADSTPKQTAVLLHACRHPLLQAMPVSAEIYACCGQDVDALPLTSGEGRKWLWEYCRNRTLCPVVHSYTAHQKNDEPLLIVKNIFYRYDKGGQDVLKGLSMQAWKGEILSVLGSNGSGKTTLLHVLAGIYRPYSGSLRTETDKIGFLPQDPKTVFLKDTLEQDLLEVFGTPEPSPEQRERVERLLQLCGLQELRSRHPYDLSGGEQQKAALAKVLLHQPDLLLLDEPVKGMDAQDKAHIGEILRLLAGEGIGIILVSHDTAFCAAYADRCALFFDGELMADDTPEAFFSANAFFTTAAGRMAGKTIPGAITAEDIKKALDLPMEKKDQSPHQTKFLTEKSAAAAPPKKKRRSWKDFFLGTVILVFLLSAADVMNLFGWKNGGSFPTAGVAVMLMSAGLLIFRGVQTGKNESLMIRRIHKPAGLTVISVLMMLAAIPLTIYIGAVWFGDAKYLFISLLIMLECTVPFFMVFENRHILTREFVLIASLCALAVTARAAFYMLPQFKPMTAVIIIAGAALGAESGFMIGSLSILISNILFGQGPWTPWQMFSMGVIGFLSGLLFGRNLLPRNKLTFCTFGFLAALLIYGGIMDPAAMLMSHVEPTWNNTLTFYLTGLPLDTVHGVSTAVFLYLAAEPILRKLERVKLKYGLTF